VSQDPALSPIRRTPLHEEVAERLRQFIDSERLEPGDKLLSERDLAARLRVSRTSVRQALAALRAVGLIDVRHGDGIYLREAAEQVIPSLARELLAANAHLPATMEVREALETEAALLAARRRTDADLAAMREHNDAIEAAIDAEGDAGPADAAFHGAVTAAARNPLLARLIAGLQEPIAETRRASLAKFGFSREVLADHRALVDAIAAGDEAQAAEAMRRHLRRVSEFALVEREGER
jgi:GntR family transcriptional regulator, transcriptional repressor for pyruvate dehydrogenase complex